MKRFFPGIDTLEERRRFVIFHACTLIIAPIISAFFIIFMIWVRNLTNPMIQAGLLSPVQLNPFSDMRHWLLWSLFVWNIIGSIRFHDDIFKEGGGVIARTVAFFCLLTFPVIYLHNLIRVLMKKA